jgi:hypothetical protein
MSLLKIQSKCILLGRPCGRLKQLARGSLLLQTRQKSSVTPTFQVAQSSQKLRWIPVPNPTPAIITDIPVDNKTSINAEETKNDSQKNQLYQLSSCSTATTTPQDQDSSEKSSWIKVLKKVTVSMFLPRGYPHSVTPDYLPFTLYQFIQSVSGTMAGTVSTQVSQPCICFRINFI